MEVLNYHDWTKQANKGERRTWRSIKAMYFCKGTWYWRRLFISFLSCAVKLKGLTGNDSNNQIKRISNSDPTTKPEVPGWQPLEVEDHASSVHPSLSQWRRGPCCGEDPSTTNTHFSTTNKGSNVNLNLRTKKKSIRQEQGTGIASQLGKHIDADAEHNKIDSKKATDSNKKEHVRPGNGDSPGGDELLLSSTILAIQVLNATAHGGLGIQVQHRRPISDVFQRALHHSPQPPAPVLEDFSRTRKWAGTGWTRRHFTALYLPLRPHKSIAFPIFSPFLAASRHFTKHFQIWVWNYFQKY